MTRPLWDMRLSELCGGSSDPDAPRLANEIERDVNERVRGLVDVLKLTDYAITDWREEAGELRGVDNEGLISAQKAIRAAIAKAEGEV